MAKLSDVQKVTEVGKKNGFTVITVDVGDNVFCDYCSEDYTNRPDKGGFLFQSKAICPECAKEALVSIKGYNEEHFIRGTCPDDMSFVDWIRSIR